LGSLLKFAEPFAKGVSTVAATALNKEASPLLQKGVELASVASGVYGTSRVFGDSPEASFDNAVLMSALHINALLGKKVEGKGIEFHDEQGNAVNVEIKDGKVQTTDKPAEIKVAIPESAKLTTVGEATLKPIDTNETKVSEPPTSVGQDEVLPEPKDQTSAAQITNNTGSPVAPEAKAATEPEVTPASETKEVAPPVSTETPSASETKPIDDIRAEMKAELSRRREAGEQLPTGLNNTANDKMFNRRVDKYLSGMREDTLRDWHSTIFDKPETKTVVHPDENINGKEIVAETQDGRVIVPNENNKSGVSIVKNYDKNAPENKPIPQPTEAPLEKQPEIVSQTGPQPTTAAGVLKEQRDLARRSAETSPVTGLPNKVAFEKARPRIEADPNQEITSIDLNNFKAINDKNSHIVGDKALNDAGKALQEAAKSIDPKAQVFHLSGDEYAVTSEKGKGRDILISADEQFSKNKYGDVQSSIGGHTADTYKEAEAGLQEAKKARKSANAIQNPERSGSSSDQGESGLSNEGRSGRSQETGGQKTSEGNTGTGAETSPKVEEPKSPISEKGKPSRVGKDIEAKAIEAKLTEGFEGTAEYSDYKNKEEGKKAADFINANPERAKRIVRGEEKLPDSVKPEAMLVGMEEYAKLNNDVDTLRDLAKSDITSETSRHAQALQYLRERDPSSPVKLIREVQKAREEAAQARLGKKSIKEAVKIESDRIKAEIAKKTPRKHDWAQFVKDIAC
jgi:diguanylate cyclase (GGDEF)-like protein